MPKTINDTIYVIQMYSNIRNRWEDLTNTKPWGSDQNTAQLLLDDMRQQFPANRFRLVERFTAITDTVMP